MTLRETIKHIFCEENDVGDFISKGGTWQVEILNRGEREYPHVHVTTPKGKISAPMLNIPDYFIHEGKNYVMNSKEKRDFYTFMKQKSRYNPNYTNWQYCVFRWNLTKSPERQISMKEKDMPNYLELS